MKLWPYDDGSPPREMTFIEAMRRAIEKRIADRFGDDLAIYWNDPKPDDPIDIRQPFAEMKVEK